MRSGALAVGAEARSVGACEADGLGECRRGAESAYKKKGKQTRRAHGHSGSHGGEGFRMPRMALGENWIKGVLIRLGNREVSGPRFFSRIFVRRRA